MSILICRTCHDQGEVFVSKGHFEHYTLTEPDPIYKACPDCSTTEAKIALLEQAVAGFQALFVDATEQACAVSRDCWLLKVENEALLSKVEHLECMAENYKIDAAIYRTDFEACAAVLPCSYYMDTPDGGDVSVLDQLGRMAKDAARYRWIRDVVCADHLYDTVISADSAEEYDFCIDQDMSRD